MCKHLGLVSFVLALPPVPYHGEQELCANVGTPCDVALARSDCLQSFTYASAVFP